jgi:carboxyl-terminal processing protease
VGTTSFGKGSVQSIMPMQNGAAMRLTIAKYYTPSHRTIHEQGVVPDIVSSLEIEDEQRISRWRAQHGTGEAAALELATLGDKQLERAVDALKGALLFESFQATSKSTTSQEPASHAPEAAPLAMPPKAKQ